MLCVRVCVCVPKNPQSFSGVVALWDFASLLPETCLIASFVHCLHEITKFSHHAATFLLSSCETLDQFSCFYSEFLNVNIFYFSVLFSGFFFYFISTVHVFVMEIPHLLFSLFLVKTLMRQKCAHESSRGIKDRFGCGQEAHWGNSRGNSIIWNWDSISSWKKPHEDLVEVLIRKWPGHFPRQKYSSCKTSQSQFRNQSSSWKKPHEQLMKKWANFLVKKKITHSKPHEESSSSWKKPHEVLVENRFPHEDLMRKWANFLVKSNSSWGNSWGTEILMGKPMRNENSSRKSSWGILYFMRKSWGNSWGKNSSWLFFCKGLSLSLWRACLVPTLCWRSSLQSLKFTFFLHFDMQCTSIIAVLYTKAYSRTEIWRTCLALRTIISWTR